MEIGSLRVGLGLDSADFHAGVQQVSRSAGTLQDRLARVAAGHDKMLIAAERAGGALSEQGRLMQMAAGSFAGVSEAAKSAAESADAFAEALSIRDRVAALHASMSPLVAATQRYDAAVDQVNRALEVGAIAQSEANTVLRLAQRRFDDAAAAAKRMDASADLAAASIRRVGTAGGGGLQNVAFQLQDMAVQIGAGTSAAQALGQQLPQLLSGFGLFGALAGTAAAVMIPLIGSFREAEEEAQSLEDQSRELADAMQALESATKAANQTYIELLETYGALAPSAREFLLATQQLATAGALNEIAEQADALAQSFGSLTVPDRDGFMIGGRFMSEAVNQLTVDMDLAGEEAVELAARMQALADAEGPQQAAGAAQDILTFMQATLGPLDQLTGKSLEFATNVSLFGERAAAMAGHMNDATASAGGLASNLNLAAQSAFSLGSAGGGILSWISSATAAAGGLASRMWGAAQAAWAFMQRRAAALSYVDSNQPGGTAYLASQYSLYGAGQQSMRQTQRDLAYAVAPIIGGGGGGGGRSLTEELTDAEKAAQELREELEKPMVSAIDGVATAFGEFVAGGLRDFKGFVSSVLGSFTKMLSQMVAQAAANPIKLALGLGGTAAAGAGQAVAETVGQAGGATGILGQIGGVAGAFGSGLSSVFTGLMSGGLSGAFGAISTALSGATAGLTGFATAVGALAVPVAAVAAVFSFFRTKTKTLDGGIRVAIDGVEALTETFQVIERRRFWGLSRSIRETFGAADRELVDAVQDTYSSLRESVLDMGSVLGIGARALNGFVSEIKLSTKGMSAEDAQAAVLAEFEKLGVQMAEQIMGTRTETAVDTRAVADAEARLAEARREATLTSNGFVHHMSQQRIAQAEAALAAARAGTSVTHLNGAFSNLKQPGENALDLLMRLSSGFLAANQAMRALGHSLFETSAAGIRASARMVEAMGGLEQFQRGVDFFFRNFYSAQEQAAFATRDFASSLRDLGLGNTPRTMEQFRAMVDRLMDAGRVGVAGQLINLAPAFVEMLRLRGELQGLGEDAEGAADRIDRAQRKADQREDLERRLLELQGNTAELRRRELAALFPANRALQRMIWGLEDAQAAMEALDEEDFATLFDFQRARGRAAAGMRPYQAAPVPQAQVAVTRDPDVQRELADLNSRLTQIMTTVAQTSRQTAQVLRKWDNIGLPQEQVA